jgi:hypothetical protein
MHPAACQIVCLLAVVAGNRHALVLLVAAGELCKVMQQFSVTSSRPCCYNSIALPVGQSPAANKQGQMWLWQQ